MSRSQRPKKPQNAQQRPRTTQDPLGHLQQVQAQVKKAEEGARLALERRSAAAAAALEAGATVKEIAAALGISATQTYAMLARRKSA